MICEEMWLLLSGHVDQENTREEEALLSAHLASCPCCQIRLRQLKRMKQDLQKEIDFPANLHEDIMCRIRKEEQKRKLRPIWPAFSAAALVLVVGLSVFLPREEAEPLSASRTMEIAAASLLPRGAELAKERGAVVVVTGEYLQEFDGCSRETLEDGSVLFDLGHSDRAAELSAQYHLEFHHPDTKDMANTSYGLLLP